MGELVKLVSVEESRDIPEGEFKNYSSIVVRGIPIREKGSPANIGSRFFGVIKVSKKLAEGYVVCRPAYLVKTNGGKFSKGVFL